MPFHLLLIPVAKYLAAKYTLVHVVAPLATPLVHTAGGAATHTAAVHTVATHVGASAAGKAGAITGKALATHGSTGIVHAAAHALPVHVLPMHSVVDVALTTGVVAGSSAAVLSPAVTHAMTKFATRVATGYSIARVKKECGGKVDLGSIRRWFAAHPSAAGSIPVTATGVVRSARFYPQDCASAGPVDLLQASYNPRTNRLSSVRLMQNADVSRPVRAGHTGNGLAFYLSGSALASAN